MENVTLFGLRNGKMVHLKKNLRVSEAQDEVKKKEMATGQRRQQQYFLSTNLELFQSFKFPPGVIILPTQERQYCRGNPKITHI